MTKIRVKIKNSVIVLGDDTLLAEIKRFDIASASPLDCHDFVRKLKEQYGK